jgi:hypothetical protein
VGGGDEPPLAAALATAGGCCPGCGRGSCEVKERPLVRVRDLPIAGRRAFLVWRKRRFRCRVCAHTFTERHEELPSRQRVTRRFRRRLFTRASEGAAHAEVARGEETSRYQVARAFALGAAVELVACAEAGPPQRLSLDEAHHRRGHELATIVSDPDNRRVVEVLEGRSRRVDEDARGAERALVRFAPPSALDPARLSAVVAVAPPVGGGAAAVEGRPERPERAAPLLPLAGRDVPATPCARRRCEPSAAAVAKLRPHSGM